MTPTEFFLIGLAKIVLLWIIIPIVYAFSQKEKERLSKKCVLKLTARAYAEMTNS